MTFPAREQARQAKRGRGGILRVLVLVAFLAGVVVGGNMAWDEYREPIKAAARDYLSFRRLQRHADALLFAAEESDVDPHLLAGIAAAESGGRLDVVSSKGAMGLFQVSRQTADWRAEILGLPRPTDEELLTDALVSARLGASNIAWLLDTFDGDEIRALCAYNAGTGLMKRLAEEAGGWKRWLERNEAAGTSAILAYAKRVLGYRDEFRERGLFREEVDVREGTPGGG